jgi:hypothetical protein
MLILATNRKVATIVTGRGQSESSLKETSKGGRTVPVNMLYISTTYTDLTLSLFFLHHFTESE